MSPIATAVIAAGAAAASAVIILRCRSRYDEGWADGYAKACQENTDAEHVALLRGQLIALRPLAERDTLD